jgi:hypothetical protein
MLLLGAAGYAEKVTPSAIPDVEMGVSGAVPGTYQPARAVESDVTLRAGPATSDPRFWTNPVPLDTAYIADYASDYDPVTGTYWAAIGYLLDSVVHIFRSTDYGATWHYVYWYGYSPNSIYSKLGLVVGNGDSNWIHVFTRLEMNNGDIHDFRLRPDLSGYTSVAVSADADTIDNFTVCRDYRSNYGLYVVHSNELSNNPGANAKFRRSFDAGNTWDAIGWGGWENHISPGANTALQACGVKQGTRNLVWAEENTHFGDLANWKPTYNVHFDTFDHYRPRIAAAMTAPDSQATLWCVYQYNWLNSGDYDVWYAARSHAWGDTWRRRYPLAISSALDEVMPEARQYKQPGYPYIGGTYTVMDTVSPGHSRVYWTWSRSTAPDSWRSPTQASDTFSFTAYAVSSLIGPSDYGGVLFAKAGLFYLPHGLYYNAGLLGIEEGAATPLSLVLSVRPNPARGRVMLSPRVGTEGIEIYDVSGRLVRAFDLAGSRQPVIWDGRDGSGHQLASGIYLVRARTALGDRTGKLLFLQ